MNELFTSYSVDIAATPEAVWQTLTRPELTRQYMFGCETVSDWRVGSRLDWVGEHQGRRVTFVTGIVVTFEPARLLEYTTFDPNSNLPDIPENHLTMRVTLTPLSLGHTRVEFKQGDFARVANGAARFQDASTGSDELLAKLKSVAEQQAR